MKYIINLKKLKMYLVCKLHDIYFMNVQQISNWDWEKYLDRQCIINAILPGVKATLNQISE